MRSYAKKAGDSIPCPRCSGAGYTLEGLTRDHAVECRRCGGAGIIVITKGR